ncbi:hypothetical protein N9901_00845 [Flavobacteriaceae bacterium]|nr:hypothetical protein [Flavobacteriaceae bacterium]
MATTHKIWNSLNIGKHPHHAHTNNITNEKEHVCTCGKNPGGCGSHKKHHNKTVFE